MVQAATEQQNHSIPIKRVREAVQAACEGGKRDPNFAKSLMTEEQFKGAINRDWLCMICMEVV